MTVLIPLVWVALGINVPLSGTVVDAGGRPVAGATVWLGDTIATNTGPEVLATAETDEQGQFRLGRDADLVGRGGMWSPTLWAYKPPLRVAFREFKQGLPEADEPVRLALGAPVTSAFRVLQPDGRPAQRARVRLALATFKAPRPPDKLLDRTMVTTDAEGRGAIGGFAPADLSALDVTVEGQIVQCLPFDADSPTLSLRPVGTLKPRIVADDPTAVRGWNVTAWSRPTEPGYRGPSTHWVRETSGDDGRVALPPIAVGQVQWRIEPPEGSSYLVAKQPSVSIRAGRSQEVEIAIKRGILVEGTVREEPGGAPLAGVAVNVASLRPVSLHRSDVVTDARGRFSTVALPGTARFSYAPFKMPKDHFLPPGTPHWVDFELKEGEERHECAPPPLRKAALVRGRVLDVEGKPTPGVSVTGKWISAEFGANPSAQHTIADARGDFVLGSIAPGAKVEVSAASGPVVTSDPLTIASAGDGEPVTLRLRTQPAVALTGRVLEAEGRPLAGALIRIHYRPPAQATFSSSGALLDPGVEIRTGSDGRFRTPAQLPINHSYRVAVEAKGYEPRQSRWVDAPATKVPDVVLRRAITLREVTGRVVDSAGKPVASAEVYQSGDGPRTTRAMTDDDGRFRLGGVPDAPAFLFVAKDGYRFHGQRIEPGDRPVEVSLRRSDEPPAARLRQTDPPVPRDEERAMVRKLVAEAKKSTTAFEGMNRSLLPAITALVDPDRAIEMIENQVIPADPTVILGLAIARSESEPGKALGFFDALVPSAMASSAPLALFDLLGTEAPTELRRELLVRAERRPPDPGDPGQLAAQLARVADRWLDLGNTERARKLIGEARELAERPRQLQWPEPRDDIALALGRIDPDAAVRLLEGRKIEPYRLNMLRSALARRVAAVDPAKARRILEMIKQEERPAARRIVCLRLAARDLAAARALAAEDHHPVVEAMLPAIAAASRAGSDPEGARVLLREAVERLSQLAGTRVRPSPSVVLARLLPLAARVDPDTAPEYYWKAVSLRAPLDLLPEPRPVMPDVRQHYLDVAELAALSARYDRAGAEAIFAPVAARLVGMDDEQWGLGNEGAEIFRAAAAYDPRVAMSLFLALAEDPPPTSGNVIAGSTSFRRSKAQARMALAKALALPQALRLSSSYPTPNDEDWYRDLDR